MPPFKLEPIKHHPNDKRVPKMLHCKKEYNGKVKITDWSMQLEYQPIDIDPYNPKCFRLHNSHYDRLGNQDLPNPISETHDLLSKGFIKSSVFEQDPHKFLINLYTYKTFDECQSPHDDISSKNCVEYMTTMQSSYQSPYPCKIEGLMMPTIKGNQNKRMSTRSECKFLDDNFKQFTQTLQDLKQFRHVSFNPCTGTNTR